MREQYYITHKCHKCKKTRGKNVYTDNKWYCEKCLKKMLINERFSEMLKNKLNKNYEKKQQIITQL